MNKCVLCTFLRMIWEGLENNTCPTIDAENKEKRLGFWKGLRETAIGALIIITVFGVAFLLVKLVMWIGVQLVLTFFIYTLGTLFFGGMIIVILSGVIKWVKIRIDCINAYWRKAKEECE